MGFLGRRSMSPATGLLAAGIAAFGPLWVQPSGKVLSESVYLVIVPVVLLATLRCIECPNSLRFATVGLAIGIAALTRSEGMSFILLLGIPLVIFANRSWRQRVRFGLILLAGFALIVGPWLIRNDVEMGGFTVSTDNGTTLVGAYSPSTFDPNSPLYGSFSQNDQYGDAAVLFKYSPPPDHAKHWTELTLNNALGHIGITYARGHLSDLPGVILAGEGRLWGVYASGSQLGIRSCFGRQRSSWIPGGWSISQLVSHPVYHRGWDSPLQTVATRLRRCSCAYCRGGAQRCPDLREHPISRGGGALGRRVGGDWGTFRHRAPHTCAIVGAPTQFNQGR